jgi:hypothetical protein
MVKPLQPVTLGFPLCIILVAALSMTISHQPPRSIAGFLLPFLFPIHSLGFGAIFVVAFNRALPLRSHPIAHFALPILLALGLVACSLLFGTWLAAFFHQRIS